jgi:hypothetical protein
VVHEWHAAKAKTNIQKHGVSSDEAATVFLDRLALMFSGPYHSGREEPDDGLRPEYDLSKLKGGVRGQYYRQAAAGTNLTSIEPERVEVFRDAQPVNRALRFLVDTVQAAAGPARRRPGPQLMR